MTSPAESWTNENHCQDRTVGVQARILELLLTVTCRPLPEKFAGQAQSCRPRGRQLCVLKPYGVIDFVTQNSN
jgi:hypothetical protein